jgi:hypothetical protein
VKSFRQLGAVPAGQPLSADEITELHAGRLLMLLRYCGTASRIDGLTKLAKLDFFVRYPDAFNRMAAYLKSEVHAATETTESPMVRHHYGPWDKRYYQILPFLEARGLIAVAQDGDTIVFQLTDTGKMIAETLAKQPLFAKSRDQMAQVKKLLGTRTGNAIKKLIYEVFKVEVADRPLGGIIR